MKDIDNLAAAIVKALALIIVLPLKIGRWALKAAKNRRKRPNAGASARWHLNGLKRSPKKVVKTAGSALDSHKLHFEEVKDKKMKKYRGGKNVKRISR